MRVSVSIAAVTIAAGLGLLGAARPAHAGDFVDTRLNFTLTNENVLVKPGETNPNIPGWRFGRPNSLGILFFDNYDTRFSGYENLSNLVLYKAGKINEHWDGEAALVLLFNQFTDVNIGVFDNGSYIKTTYYFDASRSNPTNLAITAFPMNSDRLRAGYSYRLSWGGSPAFFKFNPDLPTGSSTFVQNTNPVPGARMQLGSEGFYAFAAAKSTVFRNPKTNEEEALWGGFFGFGVDPLPILRVELNGAVIDRGKNPKQEVLGEPVTLFGVTGQVVLHDGIPVGTSADFKLYKNDPSSPLPSMRKEEYPGGVQWLVSSEFTYMAQTLQNPDRPASTVRQPALAGDVNARAKLGRARLRFDASYRTLAFILHNVPSFVPYVDFPATGAAKVTTNPDLFFAAGADYNIESIASTFGVTAGVDLPATFKASSLDSLQGNNPSPGLTGAATVVVRGEGDFEILPVGKGSAPLLAFKLESLHEFNTFLSARVQAYFVRDENRAKLVRVCANPDDCNMSPFERKFVDPNQLGFNLTLSAKF
jgi:hypothetical protein